jgi:hypothetical protein
LTACSNQTNTTSNKNDRLELVPEPDKALREEYEKKKNSANTACSFSDPDTSVADIKIRNVESTLKILGGQTKLEGDSTHIFFSSDKKQTLGLKVHPGDHFSQVSIFTISYTDNSKQKLRQINVKEFETEKGIKLGLTKNQIIEKLGSCFIVMDSTKNSIILSYSIKLPTDSKTNLLQTNNIPIYYAYYRLTDDKLNNIEFGFEYP